MWKIFVGFVGFAALALFLIMQGGDKVDMAGEAGGHNPIEHASSPASAAAPAASAASK
ncbi:MAG TPA: hypothetical protein VEC06_16840 [Paucimonas sp.]|nr:hypothetical protein [Paucimonas sp.]